MFFPLHDENPRERFPLVTAGLIAANILVWLMFLPMEPSARASMFQTYALVPGRFLAGETGAFPLLSSLFLHAGLMHLAGNMWFLWLFGDNLEEELGPLLFSAFYLLSGLGGSLAHIALSPHSAVPTVGASGAISGVMAGYLVLYPNVKLRMLVFLLRFVRIILMPAYAFVGVWFLFQLVMAAVASGQGDRGGVAFMAHVGGFGAGLVLILIYRLMRGENR